MPTFQTPNRWRRYNAGPTETNTTPQWREDTMSNTAELCARLLEHAAIHDRETSPYSPEQAAWAADLRDAAALIQAAPVVERADSATGVVECGSLNVSDNAAPVAHAEPASEPAPAPRLRWAEAPRRTEWGAGMMEALAALGPDETLRLYAHRDAVPMADALLSAQPAPARVPLTQDRIVELASDFNCSRLPGGQRWLFVNVLELEQFARAVLAAASDAQKVAP